jgi:DNA end-binding protein Ku
MRDTEYLTAIIAQNGILRAETLRFQDEIRTPEDVGLTNARKAQPAAKNRIAKAIRALASDELDEGELEDTWTERLEKLVKRKRQKGEDVVKAPAAEAVEPEDVKVIDLLEVLKRSMAEADRDARKPARKASKKGAERAASAKSGAPAGDDLESLSREELYERAKKLGVPGRSGMSKKELVKALGAA